MANSVSYKPQLSKSGDGAVFRRKTTVNLIYQLCEPGPFSARYVSAGTHPRQPKSQVTFEEGTQNKGEGATHFVAECIVSINAGALKEQIHIGGCAPARFVFWYKLRKCWCDDLNVEPMNVRLSGKSFAAAVFCDHGKIITLRNLSSS